MYRHYPLWAQEFAQKYFSKTLNQFVLHGNIRDMVPVMRDDDYEFMRFESFISDELFGSRDIVLYYDRASGIRFRDAGSLQDFQRAVAGYDAYAGTNFAGKLPKDPVRVLTLLENFFRLRLGEGKSIACIIDYAETIVPVSEGGAAGSEDRNVLVTLQKWSHDPLFLAADFTVLLLAENVTDLNRSLIQSPFVSSIKVQLPAEAERTAFIQSLSADFDTLSEVPLPVLAQQTAGLSCINLRSIISGAMENQTRLSYASLVQSKKELIEAEAYGLLEFVDTRYTLDDVAGHARVKTHLRAAAANLRAGRRDVMPMGYLVAGPVGTGKTWMVTCFAGEVGIPMVKLKNFRSQWQGVTEGNLEKILTLLDAMAPVAVMIDEADAYLGDRSASGDSGVSSRVFAQIAQFMSNTANRGRIVWFLMTARPDLMPIDLKRQGRAEEHLALLYPSTPEERQELYDAMLRKTRINLSEPYVPELLTGGAVTFSGADMEAALTRAKFRAATAGSEQVTPEILDETFADFIPPSYPEEVELQTLIAVMECTSRELLPEPYRSMTRQELTTRCETLRFALGQ
ncbi:MAG: ATPases of the AAA+ class [Bacteroidetes bacterium HLUCCA01]|nr:MAG: ATPases of the AAA+ class [Bacteroidetes bacterium HLUCCA01]